ncbi:MAG TPA: serine/threonine-protein kinase [Ktedonobacteraceae bacterium]|nr:serine/threonine-protein kinase [Ktedonobacteraceae bacterium]
MADYEGRYLHQQFGNYRLVKLLGYGGFAEVYLGEHIHMGTQTAVKVLTAKLTPEEIEHFRNEARTIFCLEHPNIVRVLDYGLNGNIPYIVMNYAANGSLRKRHPRGTRVPLPTVIEYVKQIAAALQYAHDEGLVHRDIKPDNMLIGKRNDILLSDFGIVTVSSSVNSEQSQAQTGTWTYMAPEQIMKHPVRASDQYALGITVYEWLCGKPPFEGDWYNLYHQQLNVKPQPLRDHAPEIPLAVEQMVMKALAKEPEKRFKSVKEFVENLEKAIESTSIFLSRSLATYCHFCGSPLQGSYLIYDNGLVICQRCEASVPRCSQCRIPSRQLSSVRGLQVCPACLKRALICQSCHIPIIGKYYKVGDSPLTYCETCINTRPRCDLCRAPLDEQGRVYTGEDGPTIRCGNCLRAAVKSETEAAQLYQETRDLLRREPGLTIVLLPALHIVERAALLTLNKEAGELAGTVAPIGPEHQHLLGYFKRVNERCDIFIERLLPVMLFRSSAAYELAMAWLSENAPPNQHPLIICGFAKWVAYRTLLALGEQQEAARLTRRDDIFGQGLRYFISLEQQGGLKAVMQRARSTPNELLFTG